MLLVLKLQFSLRYGLVNIVVCIVFGSKRKIRSQPCRSASNSDVSLIFFLAQENEKSFEIHTRSLACYGEDCALFDEKIDGNGRKFGPKLQDAARKASQRKSDLNR